MFCTTCVWMGVPFDKNGGKCQFLLQRRSELETRKIDACQECSGNDNPKRNEKIPMGSCSRRVDAMIALWSHSKHQTSIETHPARVFGGAMALSCLLVRLDSPRSEQFLVSHFKSRIFGLESLLCLRNPISYTCRFVFAGVIFQ
jgi:hypothetical protein